MKIVFRVDASVNIGSGHVMRCLALAIGLRENGSVCCFVCREHPGNLLKYIEDQGFKVVALPIVDKNYSKEVSDLNRYSEWLGCHWSYDAICTKEFLDQFQPDWLIIDHYGLDIYAERILQRKGQKIMVIDDLANRHHKCDLLLDQNYFNSVTDRYKGIVPDKCTILLGPKYVLLRSEFTEYRQKASPRKGDVKRVFICFGGTDPDNLTGLIIDAFSLPLLNNLKVDVVIGSNNLNRENLENRIFANSNINLHVQIDYIANLMSQADIAIGATGSTTWERMCLGLPALVIIAGENEKNIAIELDNINFIKLLDIKNIHSPELLEKEIFNYINKNDERHSQSLKIMDMVDGKGVSRVIRELQ
jgi:UDP-2,4-diacetamido-2,4,6-trideoxy-beta-L-altropyranose hydrolase